MSTDPSAMLLAGCLGGGGGGGSSAAAPAAAPAVGIGGAAAKGILKNAIVHVRCGIEDNAPVISKTPLRTSNDGTFTAEITGTCDKVVVTEVTADNQTKMAPDLGGADVDADTNLKLRHIRATLPASSVLDDVMVTPLSTLAAALVKEIGGTPDAATLQQAKQAVANSLGVNLTLFDEKPVVLADAKTPAQQQLALIGAAIEQKAKDDGKNVSETIAELLNAAKESVSKTGDTTTVKGIDLQGKLNNAIQKLQEDGVDGIKAIANNTLLGEVETKEISKPDTAVATGIANAKNLLAALKADILALWATDSAGKPLGFLNSKFEAMSLEGKDVQVAGKTLATYMQVMDFAYLSQENFFETIKEFAATANGNFPNVIPGAYGIAYATKRSDSSGTYYERPLYAEGINAYGSCLVYVTGSAPLQNVLCYVNDLSSDTRVPGAAGTVGGSLNDVRISMSDRAGGGMKWNMTRRTKTWAPNGTMTQVRHDVDSSGNITLTGTIVPTKNSAGELTAATVSGDMTLLDQTSTTAGSAKMTLNIALSGSNVEVESQSQTGGTYTDNYSGSFSGSAVTAKARLAILSGSAFKGTSTTTTSNTTTTTNTGGSWSWKDQWNDSAKIIVEADSANFRLKGSLEGSSSGFDEETGSWNSGNFESTYTNTGDETIVATFNGSINDLKNGVATPFFEGQMSMDTAKGTASVSGKVTNATKVYSLTGNQTEGGDINFTYTNPNGLKVNAAKTSAGAATINDGKTWLVRGVDNWSINALSKDGTNIGTLTGKRADFKDGTYTVVY